MKKKKKKKKKESLPQQSVQRNRGEQQNGKTGDLFKKIRDTEGTFHAKMGSIKNRSGMDLSEAFKIELHKTFTKNVC